MIGQEQRAADLGHPTTFSTTRIDVRNKDAFATVGDELTLTQDRTTGRRATWTRGRLVVVADLASAFPTGIDFVAIEVNVYGHIGSVRNLVMACAFGRQKTQQSLEFSEPYDKFAFEARQVIFGLPDGTFKPASAGFTAIARCWR